MVVADRGLQMSGRTRFAGITLLAALAACTVGDGSGRHDAGVVVRHADAARESRLAMQPGARARHGFAGLPDRGDLITYPGNVVRQDGAYRWHRAELSEAHALRAMADGHLRVATPDGEVLDIRYDR